MIVVLIWKTKLDSRRVSIDSEIDIDRDLNIELNRDVNLDSRRIVIDSDIDINSNLVKK